MLPTRFERVSGVRVPMLLSVVLAAAALRLLRLGGVFQSGDNAELAARIVTLPGYGWMLREFYGVLISLVVKLFAGGISAVGISLTEFWWKTPVALLGVSQVPLTLAFLRRMDCQWASSFLGAPMTAVLPIHVMQSRYLWGYEVVGVFFFTIAIWTLIDFLQRPGQRRGVLASLGLGLYLVSHGYTMPFWPCAVIAVALFAGKDERGITAALRTGIARLVAFRVWLFPLILSPMMVYPIRHTLSKETRLGFYLLDHLPGFVSNTGVPLSVLLGVALIGGLFAKPIRSRKTALFALSGAAYLAPLFFGTPPGTTVVRGYMLMGIYLWLLCLTCAVDVVMLTRARTLIIVTVGLVLVLTLYGSVESIFARDGWVDPTWVKIERGGLAPDPGTKAAAYVIRRYVPSTVKVIALHRAVEPPNLVYYFDRECCAYYDLSLEESIELFQEIAAVADVLIVEQHQLPYVEAGGFVRRVEIVSEGESRMWIYSRPAVYLPQQRADTAHLNVLFDRAFPVYVRLLEHRVP